MSKHLIFVAIMPRTVQRNTLLMLFWQITRAGIQGLWAIGLARWLGPDAYGFFAGFSGLATALGALSGLGFGLLLLQAVSKRPEELGAYWTKALTALALSATGLLVPYLALAPVLTGHTANMGMLLAVALPELACLPLTIVSSYAFQTRERMGWAGAMYTLGPISNLTALGLLALWGSHPSLQTYLPWHLTCALLAAIAAALAVHWQLRPGWCRPHLQPGEVHEAGGYTSMRVVDTGLGAIDKTLVLRLAGSEVAGHYTAAYRLATLIALPAISMGIAATPRLFRLSNAPPGHTRNLVLRLLGWASLAGMVSVPLTWALAHSLPLLFGPAFEPSAYLARQMAPFPALLGLSALGCSVLLTMRGRRLRLLLQSSAIIAMIGGMVWLVPENGSVGSVQALLLAYSGLTLAIWSVIWWRIASQTSN